MLPAAPEHATQHSFQSAPPSEFNHVTQPAAQQPAYQHSSSASAYVSESGTDAAVEGYRFDQGLILFPDIIVLLVFVVWCLYKF